MRLQFQIITKPTTEALTIDEVKLHLRMNTGASDVSGMIGDAIEDPLLQDLIVAAREYCEGFTRRSFMTQTIEVYLDNFPRTAHFELPRSPLKSVTSIKYKNSAGVETTMTAGIDYLVDTDRDNGRIVLPYAKCWPVFTAYPINPIKVVFVAGYDKLPKSIKQAMLLLIGHWYANREATGEASGQIAFSVKALLSPYKSGWWD